MPSTSDKQKKLMAALSHGWEPSWNKVGGKKLPSKKVALNFHVADYPTHGNHPDRGSKKKSMDDPLELSWVVVKGIKLADCPSCLGEGKILPPDPLNKPRSFKGRARLRKPKDCVACGATGKTEQPWRQRFMSRMFGFLLDPEKNPEGKGHDMLRYYFNIDPPSIWPPIEPEGGWGKYQRQTPMASIVHRPDEPDEEG